MSLKRGTKTFAKPGTADPGQVFEELPQPPPYDASWQGYAACAEDEAAQAAIEKITMTAVNSRHGQGRPWEPWCSVCPVRAHCLEHGLAEDAWQPVRSIGRQGRRHQERYVPLVYGGLTPQERRGLSDIEGKRHAARLRYEKGWLTRVRKLLRAS